MSDSLFPGSTGIFPCPNCSEMIYADVDRCRFCSAPIDRQAAAQGAELQAQVNSACNEAKLVRNGAGVMWAFLLLSMLPFMGFVWGFWGLLLGVPIALIHWRIKFGRLETSDPDYKTARRDSRMALIIWLAAVPVGLIILLLRFQTLWASN